MKIENSVVIVLKRTNGTYGIYFNGNEEGHLIFNSSLTDNAEDLINKLIIEQMKNPKIKLIFTDKEEDFKNGYLKFEKCTKNSKITTTVTFKHSYVEFNDYCEII